MPTPSASDSYLTERIRAFERREGSLVGQLHDRFGRYFESFNRELERYFLQFFVRPYPDQPGDEPPRWRLADAGTLGSLDALNEEFQSGLEDAAQAAAEDLDQELQDAYIDGYEQALWALYVGGEDDAIDADVLDDNDVEAALLASGVNGLNYRGRLGGWVGVGESQVNQLLAQGITTQQPFAATAANISRANQGILGRILALGSNELFLAGALGAALAMQKFGAAEVWVTQEDEKVCPICAPKHLTVTTEQPIIDSHPACRCYKIPEALAGARGRGISYSQFQARR